MWFRGSNTFWQNDKFHIIIYVNLQIIFACYQWSIENLSFGLSFFGLSDMFRSLINNDPVPKYKDKLVQFFFDKLLSILKFKSL